MQEWVQVWVLVLVHFEVVLGNMNTKVQDTLPQELEWEFQLWFRQVSVLARGQGKGH